MNDLSIIIPTQNRPGTLKRCLGELHKQIDNANKSFVIVVDDGSEPHNAHKNKTICELYDITYIRKVVANGPATSRNTAIKNSRSEWVAFLDDDVIVDPDWYKRLLLVIKYCYPSCVGIEGKVNASGDGLWDNEVQNEHGGAYLSCNIVYRGSILHKEQGFDQQFEGPFCEDHELASRMLQHGPIMFDPRLSVTHQPRNINMLQNFLYSPYRINTLLKSEYLFYTKHPDRYHAFRGHSTFAGTLFSLSLFKIFHDIRRRSWKQCVRHPVQALILILITLTEQLFIISNIIVYIHKLLSNSRQFFVGNIDGRVTIKRWKLNHFDYKDFTLKRSLILCMVFKFLHKPVYNALPAHRRLSRKSTSSSCELFMRIDDLFLEKPEIIDLFANIIKRESVPILASITGNDIVDVKKWPLIEKLHDSGAYIGIHGFHHKGSFGPFVSELLQMNTTTFLNAISPILDVLDKLKQPHSILIPPFNAINRAQVLEWSKTCNIICGGPETMRFTDRLYGPLALTTGGWYFPSISPFYSNAAEMTSKRIPELLGTIKGPLCLTTHFTHEAKDDFRSFINLLKTIRQYVHSWDETAQWSGVVKE